MKPADLLAVLSMLSGLTGWNLGQANAVIRVLLSSGMMQVACWLLSWISAEPLKEDLETVVRARLQGSLTSVASFPHPIR